RGEGAGQGRDQGHLASEGAMVLKRMRGSLIVSLALSAGVVFGLRSPDARAQAAGKSVISTSQQRQEVGITVYNDGFGLVREVRDLSVGTGRVALEFRDVSAQIQPETVSIKPVAGTGLTVFEQNYRYDLLSPQKLLEKYVGKKVK